jgi:hypothetical protein
MNWQAVPQRLGSDEREMQQSVQRAMRRAGCLLVGWCGSAKGYVHVCLSYSTAVYQP